MKNLSAQASVAQLVALFSRFEAEGGPALRYRLLTGRMKGQAFITLPGNQLKTRQHRDSSSRLDSYTHTLKCNHTHSDVSDKGLVLFSRLHLHLHLGHLTDAFIQSDLQLTLFTNVLPDGVT